MIIALIVVGICAFAIGYAFGSAPLQKELGRKLAPQEEISANVRLILDADRARKEAAAAHLLLEIDGGYYFIGDILLRMLTPRELYNAMGFPMDYVIDHDYRGNVYGKTKQVARCGNAVCPPMATALVRANLPEWCGKKISSMAQLEKEIAV